MARNKWNRLSLAGFLALSCTSSAWASPEVFSDYSFDAARQQAQQQHKYLIVDFMATWCGPCRMMEETTWVDEAVKSWVKENAIAVQVDIDKDRKTKNALHVNAFPTMVLFAPEGGADEFGRQVGYMDSKELLRWLNGAKGGKSAEQLKQTDDSAIWERIGKARQLMLAKQNDEALQEYVWLWNNLEKDDPQFGDLRMKMIPVEMHEFVASYPPAKAKFIDLRDAAEKADNRPDWLVLNEVLDDNKRILAWFDQAKADPKQRPTILKNGALLEQCLFLNYRWADAATYLYPDPIAKINEIHKAAEDMKKSRPDTEMAQDFDPFPTMVRLVYGAYVGAGREADAKKIADECIRLDDTPAMRQDLETMAKVSRSARAAVSKTSK